MNMPTSLHQVFYISHSRATPAEVEQILTSARRHNLERQVTGALLFTGGHFAQIIEGSAQALADTMAAIDADIRHTQVTRLIESSLPQRRFEAWTMAYIAAPGADVLIQELLATPDIPAERAERVLRLMLDSASVPMP